MNALFTGTPEDGPKLYGSNPDNPQEPYLLEDQSGSPSASKSLRPPRLDQSEASI